MRKFLQDCFLFIFPLVILSLPLEMYIRTIPNSYKYKYDWMTNNVTDVEILVFGSSHAYYGIRPEFFSSKTFNMANPAQCLAQDSFLFNYFLKRCEKLRTVILPISYFTFFSDINPEENAYLIRYYNIYMDYQRYPYSPQYHLELGNPATAMTKLKNYLTGKTSKFDKYGWCMDYRIEEKDIRKWDNGSNAIAAAMRHTHLNLDLAKANYEKLNDIAQSCQRMGVELIIITTPTWHDYYNRLDKEQLSQMRSYVDRAVRKYGIRYLDYLKDKRFEANDFYDADHLSNIGAEKFSKILDEDIIQNK